MNNFCYLRFLQIEYIRTIEVPIETNNWDVETYRNKLKKRVSLLLFFLQPESFKGGLFSEDVIGLIRPSNSISTNQEAVFNK